MEENSKDNIIEKEVEKSYLEASKNYKYPKGIVDNQAYDNYLMLSNQWKTHIQRFYKLKIDSKKSVELDLAQSPNFINKKLEEYKTAESEKKIIQKINTDIYSIIMKAILFKKRAFGDMRANIGENGQFIPDELSGVVPIVLDLYGRFFKPEEVHQTLQQDLEITNVSLYQLKTIYKENIAKIKELQEKFKNSYSDCRLGYKRSRLEELQYLYNERKQIYVRDKSRDNEKQLQSLLDSIKKEMEGDLVLNGNLNLTIENQADAFVKQEMLKEINISMFVLARIAGKLNRNPIMILSRLAHSRYAQFTGYDERGLSPTADTDDISYPSQIIYNWANIQALNKEKTDEEKVLPQIANPQRITSLRDQLLNKLKIARAPLDKGKENIQGNTIE